MDDAKFRELREESTKARYSMSDRKSSSYTRGSGDRLNNFRKLAEFLGVDEKIIMAVYYGKHDLAFYHFLATGEDSSEGIESTIDDMQNYLDLARAMVRDGGCDSRTDPDHQ